MVKTCEDLKPMCVAMDNRIREDIGQRIWESQKGCTSYAAHIDGMSIITTSIQLIAQLKTKGAIEDIAISDEELCKGRFSRGMHT